MTEKREKKIYVKPAMLVYELQQPTRLLVGSSGTEDYDRENPLDW